MASDYGQIGNSLRQRDVQYVANRDEYGIWRILDTWHPEMAAMTLTDDLDIPDDSSAVNVLKEGQFLALMKEVEQQGYMPSLSGGESPLFSIGAETIEPAREQSLLDIIAEVTAERDQLIAEQHDNQEATEDHEYRMRKLDLYETMSNKGNLDIEVAELINNSGD